MNKEDKEEKLSSYFKDAAGISLKKENRFTRTIRNVVTNWMLIAVVPWLTHCLTTYTEEDFHARMKDRHFDFLVDWKTNHKQRYDNMLWLAKKYKKAYTLNSDQVLEIVENILTKEARWHISDDEAYKIWKTIERVRKQIEDD